MNERIKKLAEQAGMEPEDGAIWWVGDGDLEKFAELIIAECCDQVRAIDAMTIRQHFGVEP